MNTSIQHPEPNGIVQPLGNSSRREAALSAWRSPSAPFVSVALFAGLLFLLLSAPAARADRNPPGCLGSGLGISLFTSLPDVHIGDTIYYSVNVFNAPFPACNAGETNAATAGAIYAFIVTPDGVTNNIILRRTFLAPGDSDLYTNVVSYVVRAQDIRPDGTIRATAIDQGDIHQNDVNSSGGGNQGVNTQVNLPCVLIAAQCVGSVGENGAITFTGTVTNCGNNTLVGVTVTNFNDNGFFTVLFPTNLAFGEVASFSGSWVPANPCMPSTAILTVLATDQFTSTPRTLTNFTTITCQSTLTPGINVTKACPAQPVSPGQLLTYSGSVSNTGNVTLTNIVVVDSQPAANTPVFTLASLAPGAVANFTGSYTAPTNCSVSDTLTATASSRCGVGVSSIASVTCPILTAPQIAVAVSCPATPAVPGGTLTYSGNVRNVGNTILTGIVVVSDQPAPNTTVFTVATLAPGASANFTSSLTVPANACSVTTTFSGQGKDICTPNMVTNTIPITCPITTAPAIAVTLACPAVPVTTGGLITYAGTVRNSGNVTLNNVAVVNNQASPSTVFTVASLAPGASANFTASFTAPANACSVTSAVTATGSDNCTETVVNNSASATCTLVTAPGITVTQNCPANPPSLGGVLTYSGTVSNAGNITLTNVVVTDDQTGANSVFTLAALAPGASSSFTGSYTVPASGCAVTSTLTANARDKCTGALVTASATATCPVQGASNIAVTLGCPDTPTPLGGLLTFSGTVRNAGTVTLTNVVVVRDAPAPNTSVFTVASLAPGASANFTGSYTVPGSNACSITTSVSASANDQCAGSGVIARATISCPLVSTPGIVVTQNCPVNPASPGGVFTYSGTVSNAGNNTLTNIVVLNHQPAANTVVFTQATLASGASTNFTASYTVPSDSVCSVTSVVTATANDICSGNAVTNSTTATCPLTMAPRIAVTLNCPEVPAAAGGLITYRGTVSNPGNVTLNNVTVVDSQSAPSTVLTVPSLAPGGSANFTASFTAPANACSVSSTVTASGSDACVGTVVTGVASATCPISTAPAIAVTLACPAVPVAAGSLITYAGTVRNSGNVTLNNVAVVNNQASPSTVFTVASLAPGVSANFTASFTAPANACSVTSAVTATGSDNCTENVVNNSASATCTLVTAPGIAVAQNCPVSPASPGGLVTYSGSVSNTGNITLTNVVVSNSQSGSGTGGGGGGSVSTAGLVGYWAFDEASGSVAIDGSGLGNNGNIINATRVPGESGGALSFNGNAYVDLGNNASMNFSGAVTISAWINPQSVVAANDILSHGYSASPIQAVFMHIYQGRYEVGSQINNGTAFVAAAAVPAGDIGTFVHLAGVYDGSTWTLYRNGVAVATTPSGAVSTTVNANWAIGARGGGGSQLFNGVIDEVRLYQRALSAAEIGLLAGQTITPGPGPASTVFTAAILAPGAVANFTFSVTVPTNSGCAITSTLTGSGNDTCTGSPVTANVSSSCPLVTAPLITVTQTCPVNLVSAGGILTYSGTVSNAGNITLTNIVVTDNRPADNTVIFTAASLAPGASANFSGSYEVPINCCVVWSTATASGQDTCVGTTVTDTDTTTCTVLTMPSIVVTKTCPPTAAQPGDVLQYSGTVSNAGNITLVDVTIVNSQPGDGSTVWGPITLAPGESANYYASYLVPPDFCGTDTITAQGLDACTFAPVVNSVTTTCPILTTPRIAVTKNCPAQPTPRGGVFTFTGTVSNPGDVTLINVMVANNYQADCYLRTNGPVIGPITLAPGASVNFSGSYTAPLSCCEVMDTLTASGQDRCAGTRVMATATAICPLLSTPHITVTRVCPASPVPVGGVFAYSGSVSNAGDVVLTNVYVLSSKPNANTSVLGPMALAPGETEMFSGSYTVTANSDPTTDTVTASGTDICQGQTVTTTANCSGPVGPLIVSSVTLANGTATVTWMATPGVTYRLQCASNYQNSVWINVPGDVTAISNTVSKNEAVGTTPQRFYRVMVVK
jgi:uncharacterized repeat protein (TIGR01451 family)